MAKKKRSLNAKQPPPEKSSASVMVLPIAIQIVQAELGTTAPGIVIIRHLRARAEQGKKEYGDYLHTFNGRQTGGDLWQEKLDGLMYAAQILMEKTAVLSAADPIVQSLGDWIREEVTQLNNLYFILQSMGEGEEDPAVLEEVSKEDILVVSVPKWRAY